MRHQLLTWLFELTAAPYAALKRDRVPWDLSPDDLLRFPAGSLGRALGQDLKRKGFTLMPRLEVHDVCHLLTGVDVDVPGEIALQFLLFGNGKRSPYLFGVLFLGTLLFPEHLAHFVREARRGSQLAPFYDVDYRPLLARPLADVLPTRAPGAPCLPAPLPARSASPRAA